MMYWIKASELQTGFMELFEKFWWKQYIQLQIDIVIICRRLSYKGIPHSSRMCVF